ncbi:MAG TPA: PadR family transcriptional regulator [Acidimicrobiales bacterium]|jgi:DNA-binding PadR family transcriptional regulator|nr:PadR family transcriptional regulator [Acidimicrobiales bacterium]
MQIATSNGVSSRTSELSRPDYVALGMIRLGVRSGYEIKEAVELSIRFFWTISRAQIYPSLERLEEAGLVEGTSEPAGRRQRRTFQITEAGDAALQEWLQRDEPMPFELRDIGMVKLFFADVLDRDEALALLDSIRHRSEERVATLRSIVPTAQSVAEQGNTLPGLTLRMGIAFHQAMIDVCREFESEHQPTDPRS